MDETNSIFSTYRKQCEHCNLMIESNTKHNLNRKYARHISKFHRTADYLAKLEKEYNDNPELFIKYASIIINRHKQKQVRNQFILTIKDEENKVIPKTRRKPRITTDKKISSYDMEELEELLNDQSSITYLLNSIFELKNNNTLYSELHRRNIKYSEYDIFVNRLYNNNISDEWKSKINNKIQRFLKDRNYTVFNIKRIIRRYRNCYDIIYGDDVKVQSNNLFKSIKDRLDDED
jgi:hypothetical protein